MSYFTDKERFRKFNPLRLIYFIAFLLSFALTEIGSKDKKTAAKS